MKEICRRPTHGDPCNGEPERTGDLQGPRLGGLSTTLSFTSFFEKSMVAEAASVVENITYGLEY